MKRVSVSDFRNTRRSGKDFSSTAWVLIASLVRTFRYPLSRLYVMQQILGLPTTGPFASDVLSQGHPIGQAYCPQLSGF